MATAAVCEQPPTSGVPNVVREIRRTGRIDWPALRRYLQEASGNDIVEVLGWTVNYDDGELGMVCRVVPTEPRSRVSFLVFGLLSLSEGEPLCASFVDLNDPGSTAVTGLACTNRFEPEVDGSMVLSLVLGIVETEAGEELFAFEEYFEVSSWASSPRGR